jgi:hypothetical protein
MITLVSYENIALPISIVPEVFILCASFLSLDDIALSLSFVCKSMAQIAVLPSLWCQLFLRHFGSQAYHLMATSKFSKPHPATIATSKREWRLQENRKAYRKNLDTLHLSFQELAGLSLWSQIQCASTSACRRRVFDWRKAFVKVSMAAEKDAPVRRALYSGAKRLAERKRNMAARRRSLKTTTQRPSTAPAPRPQDNDNTPLSRIERLARRERALQPWTQPGRETPSIGVGLGLGRTGKAKLSQPRAFSASAVRKSSSLSIISPSWAQGSLPPTSGASVVASIPIPRPQMNSRSRVARARPVHRGRCLKDQSEECVALESGRPLLVCGNMPHTHSSALPCDISAMSSSPTAHAVRSKLELHPHSKENVHPQHGFLLAVGPQLNSGQRQKNAMISPEQLISKVSERRPESCAVAGSMVGTLL